MTDRPDAEAPTGEPYGAWHSPISAEDVARAGIRVAYPTFVGDEVWWVESRPAEDGRAVVVASARDGSVRDVLPPGWSARTRVHEYGGLCYLGYDAGGASGLVFTEWADQRLYRLGPGDGSPLALTPVPAVSAGTRYADLVLDAAESRVVAVRESHTPDGIRRDLVAVPLDGRGGDDPLAVEVLAVGGDFLANPRISPGRQHLAWLRWDHPNMPWDGTQLVVSAAGSERVLLGGIAESVTQVEWVDDRMLYAVSDRSGWWNLYELRLDVDAPRALCPLETEVGGPLWQLGARTFTRLGDGRLAVLYGTGSLGLGVLDPATGDLTAVATPWSVWGAWLDTDGNDVVGVAAAPDRSSAVVRVQLDTGATTVLRSTMPTATASSSASSSASSASAVLPEPRHVVVPGVGGREVHANLYPPRNPAAAAGPGTGELAPYVVFVHGGPTGHSPMVLDLTKAYFTSRGIGVVDVNYGGSTGYGRAYRDRLRGTWGIVDVEDCVSVATWLADEGLADGARIAIRGGSAGGWTVLAAVTSTDVFACGTSLFGVAELESFAATTHDFESRYVHGLVGDPAVHTDIFIERSPLSHADRVGVPVLLLQGSDDLVVPPEQSELFRDALLASGVAHAYIVFEGEQHGFRKATSIVRALEAELSFYGQVMGFDPLGVARVELTGAIPSRGG